jgi:hypothetical protein
MSILEEINRMREIIGLDNKTIITEQAWANLFRTSADDAVRAARGTVNVTDDIINSARTLAPSGRRALVSSTQGMIGNIAKAYGDDVAKEYVRIAKQLSGKQSQFPQYFQNGRFSPSLGQRDAILRRAISNKNYTAGTIPSTAGKAGASAAGKAGTRAVGSLTGLGDDVVKQYKLLRDAAKQKGSGPGWTKSGKFNPGEGTRERWIKEAIAKAQQTNPGKKLSWKQWLAVGAAIGIPASLLYFALQDTGNGDVLPEEPPTDEETVYQGGEETTVEPVTEPWYEGDLCSRDLMRGKKGDDVKDLQIRLNKLYSFNLEEDGLFGPDTKSKVMEYQRKNQLEVNGIFDSVNCEKLTSLEGETTSTETQNTPTPVTEPTPVKPEVLATTVNDAQLEAELTNKPEEVIAVEAPENTSQLDMDDVARVESTKKCKEGKQPVLVKMKEKQVNRGGRMINKTIAVYRCKKLNSI